MTNNQNEGIGPSLIINVRLVRLPVSRQAIRIIILKFSLKKNKNTQLIFLLVLYVVCYNSMTDPVSRPFFSENLPVSFVSFSKRSSYAPFTPFLLLNALRRAMRLSSPSVRSLSIHCFIIDWPEHFPSDKYAYGNRKLSTFAEKYIFPRLYLIFFFFK